MTPGITQIAKGGESLGDEESSKEEKEVSPASILAPGARPLAPDVIKFPRTNTAHTLPSVAHQQRRDTRR